MIKYQEYLMSNTDCPYDMKEYHKQREAIRAEINLLQKELSELEDN